MFHVLLRGKRKPDRGLGRGLPGTEGTLHGKKKKKSLEKLEENLVAFGEGIKTGRNGCSMDNFEFLSQG